MIYSRFRSNVSDEQKPLSYPPANQTAVNSSSHGLAGVASASSTWWDLAHDDQLHLVVCHSGLSTLLLLLQVNAETCFELRQHGSAKIDIRMTVYIDYQA